MAALTLSRIAKRYGALSVIEDLSLEIEKGEFVVLVGPSGCGKSTLLRMIAGLEGISAGDLLIDGRRANDTPPQRRNIAMVFQSYALFPHMTAAGNIGFGPRIRGEDPGRIARRVASAAEVLNLAPHLDRRPGQLSGGQRQRVAMGRAMVREPTVFLFDEPLSNLDAKLRVQMRTEIKSLHQTFGTTIVYVTHDQIEAMTMADRIVVMNAGRIEQAGSPLELYDRPANLFVAGFIGSPAMGLIPGRLAPGAAVLDDGARLPCAGGAEGRPVTLGVRPEAWLRDPDGPVALAVEVVEPTGPEIQVYGRIGGVPLRVVFRDRVLPNPGDTLRLSVDPTAVHLFDAATGTRL
jgi:multiple sugar transport system ATP-binding protein